MRGPLPRTLIFRGVVEAAGFLIDAALLGEAEARRRILELWEPGATVYRVARGWLIRLPGAAARALPIRLRDCR